MCRKLDVTGETSDGEGTRVLGAVLSAPLGANGPATVSDRRLEATLVSRSRRPGVWVVITTTNPTSWKEHLADQVALSPLEGFAVSELPETPLKIAGDDPGRLLALGIADFTRLPGG